MRILRCLEQLVKVIRLPGDVIELGVASGDTTFPMAYMLSEMAPAKMVYACDTFSGLPYDDAIISPNMCKKGEINHGNRFFDIMGARGYKNITCIKGLVEETLPKCLVDKKFCFAWVDMDLYQPTSFAYKFLEDRMAIGGIIGFHDYRFIRCPGIEKVVEKEIDYTKYRIISNLDTCVFLQRYA
jgi:hypothetical protein